MYCINNKEYKCSVAVTLDIFNDRWKLAIIWHLLDGQKRFKELHEDICEITQKTLTIKLKELEEKKIIHREVYAEVPPKVIYSLTSSGEKLRPVLENMYEWGIDYVKEFGEVTCENSCANNFYK
ncbi:winged helix-turn-helix transcriptional regulator [Aliarcobacter lanthieri]|uniref:winged helix-turn-helix transcriptional regulator n=1 Tax=Arcobacteraceae TaxID=2808963 RepID=UPI00047A3F4A|nr:MULTISPECIES: helix-turn-helix domain-containing protein [Arcobacteraceae]MBL3519966.1 helix-turn-helix transcriptional regulator [Aliarcobacter lanthieri]QKF59181.1 transcriptional regulator, HxlR family [Aliarcobacter lanthieri]RBQ26396.1 transcriptional regulator [Arcobacter sp. CECT 9188]